MIIASLISYLIFQAQAGDDLFLKQIHVEKKGPSTFVYMDMSKELDATNMEVRFLGRTIEWDINGAKLKKDKMFVDVSSAEVNNIYASNHDTKGVRVRVNLNNDKTASNFHEQVRFIKNKDQVTMVMDGEVTALNYNIKELSRIYDIKTESMDKVATYMAAQSVIKADETPLQTAETVSQPAPEENKDEKEIPLAATAAKSSVESSSAMGRMMAGMVVVCLLLAGVYYGTRKINQKRSGLAFNHDSIKVVAQKYLGPKRTLTLIRVSGEYLLLGVTEQNISLIKQLSVVDDEIPDLEPQEFKASVKKAQKQSEMIDLQAIGVEDSFSVSSLSDVKKIFQKRKYIDEVDV